MLSCPFEAKVKQRRHENDCTVHLQGQEEGSEAATYWCDGGGQDPGLF